MTPALSRRRQLAWRVAQAASLLAMAALVTGLFARPAVALPVFWNVAFPAVFLSLLVTPHLWRNVCPMATLNMLSNGWVARRMPSPRTIGIAGAAGTLLLLALVPARRWLFNADGESTALLLGGVALAAMALGAVFDAKAGFCNTLCPVLPVERLLGQRPLVDASNPRCPSCSGCSVRGCIDLAPAKSIVRTLGRRRRSDAWVVTAYGVFAAAYPGLVFGYFRQVDGAPAPSVYFGVVTWAAVSFLAVAVLVRAFHMSAARAMPLLAAAAAGLYFWFAAPLAVTTLGVAGAAAASRTAVLALVGFWYVRAARRPVLQPTV